MLSLSEGFHQSQRFQTEQVGASGGWTYLGDDRKLGARARAAVEEAVEHPRSRRLADGGGNRGGGCVVGIDIHTSMVDESLKLVKWHDAGQTRCAGYLHRDRGRKWRTVYGKRAWLRACEDREERPHVSSRLRRARDPFEAQGRRELQEER
jgi:hypothetical protein